MDELSPLFQEIEFSERWRGYDPDEVDAFVDRVARAAAHVQGELSALRERAEVAEGRGAAAPGVRESEETLTRTLVLAQKTADAAVAEARDEARATIEEARAEADALLAEAEVRAAELVADADAERRQVIADAEAVAAAAAVAERDRLAAEVGELQRYRAYLSDDIGILERFLADERERLRGSVATLTDLLDAPEAFRPTAVPATSGVEIDEARLAPSALEPEPIEDPDLEAAAVPVVDPTVAPVEAVDEPDPAEPSGDQPPLVAHDVIEPMPVLDDVIDRVTVPGDAQDEVIDLVGGGVEAASDRPSVDDTRLDGTALDSTALDDTALDSTGFDGTALDDTALDSTALDDTALDELFSAPPADGATPPADRPEGGTTEVMSPPRLVTAADLGETEAGDVIDPGPATAPMPALEEQSLFAAPDDDDDPFLAQLRDAVGGDEVLESEDEALSAFFDQDDHDGGRSWFGRRR